MFKGKYTVATPRNKDLIMPPSGKPKGMGRKNPHSGIFTRGTKQSSPHAIAISNGLDKINFFFTGSKQNKPVIHNK